MRKPDSAATLRPPPEALHKGQTKILEWVALGEPLPHVLDGICHLIEEHAPGVLCSVLLTEGNTLRHGAAPSLPTEYCDAIDGVSIGPSEGSCGTAAHRNEQVIVAEIATDPLWANYRDLALAHGLQACWSTPIRSRTGAVLGTFAMYYREPRAPSANDLELVADATHLVGIAVERDRSEAERRALEAQVRQADKLESLGKLAGMIAYDFHDLLMRILGDAALARVLRDHTPTGRQLFESIERAARRALDLTNQLLTYSGRGANEVCAVFVNRLIQDANHLIEAVVADNATVQFKFGDPVPPIMADPNLLRQAIMNLVANASEALDGKPGPVTITTGVMDVDRDYLATTYLDQNLDAGSYVFVEVADSGRGMEPGVLARMFDPFFSTKEDGGGLGMASVLGMVKAHHGTIKVDSTPAVGTTIRVLLPRPKPTTGSPKA